MAEDHQAQNPSIRKPLTAERLREVLHYDPETGVFTWLECFHRRKIGKRAGYISPVHGYRMIGIDKGIYRAGRLAWLYVHGQWPDPEVDHKNTVEEDDRIDNLREADRRQQNANVRCKKNSRSGIKGVERRGNSYRAAIRLEGRMVYLGTFSTAESAARAYLNAAIRARGEFARQ